MCGTAGDCSPASFNPHSWLLSMAMATVPMEVLHSGIESKGIVSTKDVNPVYIDQYVLQSLRRIGDIPQSELVQREGR